MIINNPDLFKFAQSYYNKNRREPEKQFFIITDGNSVDRVSNWTQALINFFTLIMETQNFNIKIINGLTNEVYRFVNNVLVRTDEYGKNRQDVITLDPNDVQSDLEFTLNRLNGGAMDKARMDMKKRNQY